MAASAEFDFNVARHTFADVLEKSLDTRSSNAFISYMQDYHGSESERKLSLDQAFRDVVKAIVTQAPSNHMTLGGISSGSLHHQQSSEKVCAAYKDVISFAVDAATNDVCSASTPFVLLSDVFDMVLLDQCEDIFNLVEDQVSTWKSDTFYDAGKNYLLRMCNDLLRRLSKSQNTVFCGRIQLFLSRLFPLSEKSALNLMSQFNLDNVTIFSTKPERSELKKIDKDEKINFEEGEMDENTRLPPIDYNLYRKFWMLQDYFRKPILCYDKNDWKIFVINSEEVLNAFASSKLDDIKSSGKRLEKQFLTDSQTYFAKYLTSEKLLDLQLGDSHFRRYVLVQFLILMQYLNAPVKFKSASFSLTDEQILWIKNTEEIVYQLVKETPPGGEQFCKAIQHILKREENWNTWKNESCPSFERTKSNVPKSRQRLKRKTLGEDLMASGNKIIKMGSAELTRLWNLCPNNIEACTAEKRVFLPTLEEYFVDAIEQANPETMIVNRLVYDEVFQWKALRLLACRSPHFFTHTHQPAVSLPVYLESMVTRLAKEMPPPHEEMKTEVGEEEDIKEPSQDDEDDMKQNDESGGSTDDTVVTKQQVQEVAERLGTDWRKLAVELDFEEDFISRCDIENSELPRKALRMLNVWCEREADNATPGNLRIALEEIGLLQLGDQVFSSAETI